jgi:hypothetical protein
MFRIPSFRPNARRWETRYESVEYFLGVACPLLGALSVLDHFGLIRWTWLVLFWMSAGHYALYFYDIFPSIKYRPFFKGMFVFGVGVAWPLWCLVRVPKKRLPT